MAEHRRVESRHALIGSGALNDPDRLEELERRRRLSESRSPLPPKVKFGQVLAATPLPKAQKAQDPFKKRPLSKKKYHENYAQPGVDGAGFGKMDDDFEEPAAGPVVVIKG